MESSSVARGLFYGGLASCIAETITLPVDVVKTRMQFAGGGGAVATASSLLKVEGIGSFWKGLSPALLRQSTYGSLRYGLYGPIRNLLGVNPGESSVRLYQKILAGAGCGAVASFIANPTDLIKVRMQVDGMDGTRPRYTGLMHAFRTIVAEEGFLGLWAGVGPTCGRATVLAAAELSSYDEIKSNLIASGWDDGFTLHLATAMGSGFIATAASSPLDVVKSRVMGQPVGADGRGKLYSGMVDCFAKTLSRDGPMTLWSGFWPNYGRVGPRVVIVFVVMEQLKKLFN